MPRRRRGPRLDTELIGADLREALRQLDLSLRDLAGGEGVPPGFDPTLFLAPGLPRVRPLLVLLSARAARIQPSEGEPWGDESAARHVAAAAELLHIAIVLHDAALGRQGGRRRRAARRIIGGAVGILGGNHLTLRAIELARQAPAPEIVGDLLETLREIGDSHALGQTLRDRRCGANQALALAEGHSGAVFSFACRAGGRLAGAERPVCSALGRYGRHTGIAWHIAEDLALLTPGEDEEDLSWLCDRAADGRPSFTLALAIERDPHIWAEWLALAQAPAPELALAISHRIRATGATTRARERLVRETWAARQALSGLNPSASRDLLDRIASTLARNEPIDPPRGPDSP